MSLRPARLANQFLACFGVRLERLSNAPRVTLLGWAAKPVRTVIDVGANRGQFARSISKIFPRAKLHSFEPLPGPFEDLRKWASGQGGRVQVYNLALGDEKKTVTINLHEDHSPSSSILSTTDTAIRIYPKLNRQHEVLVQQTTLDDVLGDSEMEGLVLIKLDVQGYEDHVVRGGKKVFSRADACICEISLDTLYEGQATFDGVIERMRSIGFRYAGNISQSYGKDGHCIFMDILFVRA